MPVHLAMYEICHMVQPLHPASQLFLDSFTQGEMSRELFQRFFSLPNSTYIGLAECILHTILPLAAG